MIRVERVSKPSRFDRDCRRPGKRWLAANPGRRPRAFWAPFTAALAEGFHQRCGYSAVLIQNGTIDHFLSWKNLPELTYEWSNYSRLLRHPRREPPHKSLRIKPRHRRPMEPRQTFGNPSWPASQSAVRLR